MSEMVKTKVNITQSHILSGRKGACRFCPIALALKDAFPESTVHVQGFYFTIDGVQFQSPKEVVNFISDFDSGLPVRPFSFELRMK